MPTAPRLPITSASSPFARAAILSAGCSDSAATCFESPVPGAQLSGKFSLGHRQRIHGPESLRTASCGPGTSRCRESSSRASRCVGTIENTVKFSLHDDGSVTGEADASAEKLILKSARLAAPENLGEYSLHAAFEITDGQYSITKIILRRVNTPVLSGATELVAPNSNKPLLGIHLGGFHFDAAEVKQRLLSVRHLPADLGGYAQSARTRQGHRRRRDAQRRTRRDQDGAARYDSQEPRRQRHHRRTSVSRFPRIPNCRRSQI